MKVNTDQSATFADSLVDIPESGLDGIKAIIDIVRLGSAFTEICTDYDPESLFRAQLLREFYNLSYERLSTL